MHPRRGKRPSDGSASSPPRRCTVPVPNPCRCNMPPTVVRSLGPPLGPPALPPIRPSALATVPLPPLHAVVPVLALSSRALPIGAPSIRGSTCRALPFLYRLPMSLFAALLVVVPVLFPSTTVSFLFFPRFLSIAFLAFGLSYIKFLPSSCPCPCPPGVRARLVFVPAWCPCPPVPPLRSFPSPWLPQLCRRGCLFLFSLVYSCLS